MAMALGFVIRGLLNVEGMNMSESGEEVIYTVEVDAVFGERLASLKAKIATALDLPLRIGHIEEVEEIIRGVLVKAYRVRIAVPKHEVAHKETRIKRLLSSG